MEKSASERIGIRIYSQPPPPPYPPGGPKRRDGGPKRRAMSNGVQRTLSKTSLLANFLPTGTLLTFEMVLPSIYANGECSPVKTHMIYALCGLSCFFFHFTDSFKGPDGKVYYGFVTPRGLAVFKSGLRVDVPRDDKFRVGLSDFVHAMMSVLVIAAIAFSDYRVTRCVFPGHAKELGVG
ncbi:hypothetical protein SASPL_141451 [Salvia splendens]|uniref:Uncharacterized protein n=1 Tax=Salvia splendens TaxID=180675 RepID=A0A8X8WTN7_SALSN|nr:hypothetical protein SASPL_141451 [Salvia splendens]